MPLTITEEMVKKNPFFKKVKEEGLQEAVKSFYVNLELSVKEITKSFEYFRKRSKKNFKRKQFVRGLIILLSVYNIF
ncbi:hypothetical protein [Persephonella sp.]